MDERIKSALLVCLTCLALAFVGGILKYQEDRDALPTPLPAHWNPIPIGNVPKLPASLLQIMNASPQRPVLLNFYNPDCPCSRYNAKHLRSLVWRFGRQVTFIAILQGKDPQRLKEQFEQAGAPMASLVDTNGEIAGACSVISSPQAVLLDCNRRIYFRGNYNQARYCYRKETEFARIAMEALLSGNPCPAFPRSATTAYGCALPAVRRTEPR